MSLKIEDETRQQIAAFLPDALMRALTSYFEFSKEKPDEEDSKRFAAQHSAAKAALAHIELIIKLAKVAGLPDPKDENHNRQIVLAAMLKEAEGEVSAYKEKKKT